MKIKKSIIQNALPLALIFSFAGCAGMTQKKNAQEIKAIKKVAIVALSQEQPDREGGLLGTHSGRLTTSSDHVNAIYAEISKTLAQKAGWQVVSLEKVKNHAAMKAQFQKLMTGFQNKMPPAEGTSRYYAPGIPDFDSARLMKPEGRDSLAKALGVDAVVAIDIRAIVGGFQVMGIGARPLKGMVSLYAYKNMEDSPFWFETFEGEETKESMSLVKGKEDMDRLVLIALKKAMEKVQI